MHCFEEQFIRSFKLVKDRVSKDRIDTVSEEHHFLSWSLYFSPLRCVTAPCGWKLSLPR